ncbi:MAG: ABC transporter substrate-binding protein [Clostridia bacterium]|nr:ABC transporter substrate-binding protein [Clostridia bacterium]
MIKRMIAAVLLAALLMTLGACGSAHVTPPEGYTFTDDTGREMTVGEVTRAAVLFSSFAEVWTLAGGEIAITVGESVERGFADETTPLADDGAGKTINVELLLAARPDFILYSADIPAQAEAARLVADRTGIPAAGFSVETFEDYLRLLSICTAILQTPEAYLQYGETPRREIEVLRASLATVSETPRILFIRSGQSARSAKAKTAEEHFACAMLRELGTYNIAENARVLLDGLSIEEILTQDPDMIFITTMGDEAGAVRYMQSVLAEPAWQSLDAVQQGRVYFLPKDLFQYKPNARWAEAYRYLADIVYGEELYEKIP